MLTGNKDVDRKILNELEDEDLVSVCQVNKKAEALCNDQVFWMNRVFLKFGYVPVGTLKTNKADRTWSEYYIKDLRKINPSNSTNYLLTGSKTGRLDHVMISLRNGANIHVKTDWPLRQASQNGHLDVVKYLVSQGANIHASYDYAVRNASGEGHLDVVKYLVSQGANIRENNNYAIKVARIRRHLDVVKYLSQLYKTQN